MELNLYDFYWMMQEKHISIIYMGPMWTDSVGDIGNTLKQMLKDDNASFTLSQSVFSVFIEQMNNIVFYSTDKASNPSDASRGIIVLGSSDRKYFIRCGNMMKTSSIPILKERINRLNAMSKEELRKYYREKMLAKDDNPESKGAGLGLIEIARRATEPLQCHFTEVGDGMAFFTIEAIVGERNVQG